jgi:beta-aspartyl-peptidase (threonine type)
MVHGGAGIVVPELVETRTAGCERSADAGWRVLLDGGSALDAVVAAVTTLEDDPSFNAGRGSCLNIDGAVEMDASIMDGERQQGGGVALVSSVVNPILLARAVMEDARHVLLAGAGAERFAREQGLATADPDYFVTPRQIERWRAAASEPPGTVGAVALDRRGHVAAATSTGGIAGKRPGRVGDSAILGAGTFADDRAGAASATGLGEAIVVAGLTRRAIELLSDGRDPAAVAALVIHDVRREAGIILVDRFGRVGWACNTAQMPVAVRGAAAASAQRAFRAG